MGTRLGDRNDYKVTDLPICKECGVNTQTFGWVNRVASDTDICGKTHAEGEQANREDIINIEIYLCGTCIGDLADEVEDDWGGTTTDWDAVEKEVEENWIPQIDKIQPLAKEWREVFNFSECGYGHADLEDIKNLWEKSK